MTNPYLAPQSSFEKSDLSLVRVERSWLIVRTGVTLPKRCYFCNADCAQGSKKISTTIYYTSSWLYWLIIINIFLLALAYYLTRKRLSMTYYICADHARQRRNNLVSFLGVLAFSVAGFIVGIRLDNAYVLVVAAMLLAVAMIFFYKADRLSLTPSQHDTGKFWLKGADRGYLDGILAEKELED